MADTVRTPTWLAQNNVLEERSESSASPGFGSFRTPNADRTTLLTVEASAQTDGAADGTVELDVDKDGGTSPDFTLTVANVGSTATGGTTVTDSVAGVPIPAGASYQVSNASDPNAANSLDVVREQTV